MSAKFPLPARPSFVVAPSEGTSALVDSTNAEAGPSRTAAEPTTTSATDPAAAPTFTTPEALTTAPILPTDRTKCALCASPPKYTCPRCSLPTCSLPCSTSHKTLYSCSGQRDTSAFVPLAKYTQGEWGGDYAYLEATRRQVSLWGKDVSAREVERQEEVKRVKEREERRKYREQKWAEGEKERREEEERRKREEEVRRARARGEVGWGRAFVPGLPGIPGAPAPALPGATPASTPTTHTFTSTPTQSDTNITTRTPHYASLLDPATAVALNRANLAPDDSPHARGGAGGKGSDRNKKRPNRGGKLDAFMWEMRKRGVWVEFMPEGMERRRVNQSRWNAGSQELYITLQMIIPLDILPSASHSTETDVAPDHISTSAPAASATTTDGTHAGGSSKLSSAKTPRLATPPGVKVKYTETHATVTFTQVLLFKGVGVKGGKGGGGKPGGTTGADAGHGEAKAAGGAVEAVDREGEPSQKPSGIAGTLDESLDTGVDMKNAATPLPTLSSLLTPLLPFAAQNLIFALPFHPSPARPTPEPSSSSSTSAPIPGQLKGKPHFPPIDPSVPLAAALRGTAYVEFPILSVFTRDAWEKALREGKVREVGLAEPRNRRDVEGRDRNANGEGRGANEVPVKNKRAASQGGAKEVDGAGQEIKRARTDAQNAAGPAVLSASSASAPPPSATASLIANGASPAVATAPTAAPAVPSRPAPTSALSGLSALGGYGSDSDSDAEADSDPALQVSQVDTDDLGYYDKPAAGESSAPGISMTAGTIDATGNADISAAGIAEDFGLSGEMLQAVGQALAADLS